VSGMTWLMALFSSGSALPNEHLMSVNVGDTGAIVRFSCSFCSASLVSTGILILARAGGSDFSWATVLPGGVSVTVQDSEVEVSGCCDTGLQQIS